MEKFFKYTASILSMILAIILFALTLVDMAGLSDSFYKRFTTKGHTSLILGTSRAAQGIVPEIIDSVFSDRCFDLPIYNFAFTVGASPYGELYYNTIAKTISCRERGNSLFILAVDPYALSMIDEIDSKGLRENKQELSRVVGFHRPNYFYLLRYCHIHQWINNTREFLHDDGWLEITGVNISDSASVENNIQIKMQDYRSYTVHPSEYRTTWLLRTISLLEEFGEVYLCRIPVSKEMATLEASIWPDFDKDMRKIKCAGYFSFFENSGLYRTTDGNHLYSEDAKLFTKALCDSISFYKK